MSTQAKPRPTLELTVTTFACPFQAEGRYEDMYFYYRARHGDWAFFVSPIGTDDATAQSIPFAEGRFRTYFRDEHIRNILHSITDLADGKQDPLEETPDNASDEQYSDWSSAVFEQAGCVELSPRG